jgi:hypothetical protein
MGIYAGRVYCLETKRVWIHCVVLVTISLSYFFFFFFWVAFLFEVL